MIVRITRLDNGGFHDYSDMDSVSIRINICVMNRWPIKIEYL